jgi:hypothetical protein
MRLYSMMTFWSGMVDAERDGCIVKVFAGTRPGDPG